jgi:hypothetical protein
VIHQATDAIGKVCLDCVPLHGSCMLESACK